MTARLLDPMGVKIGPIMTPPLFNMYTLLLLAEVQLNFDYSAYITTCLIKPNVF